MRVWMENWRSQWPHVMALGTAGGLPAEQGLLGRTRGHLSHGLLFLFLMRYPDWAERGRKDCVRLWVF